MHRQVEAILREEAKKRRRRGPPPWWNSPPRRPFEIHNAILDWFDKNGRSWTTMAAYRKMRDARVLDGSPWEQRVSIEFIEDELGYGYDPDL